PSSSSIFSAATFEFGGPHFQDTNRKHQPGQWSILTALGEYTWMHGGHIVLWDLGLVVSFPAGSTILLSSGLLRYSFVKVRETERRYTILQWAGAGITRWFLNGRR
ncbi:hypothetical protein B0H13DRAFT_1580198, partial [Mycena leptocephala]